MTTETPKPDKTFTHFSWRGGHVTAAFWNLNGKPVNVQTAFSFCSPLDTKRWNRKLGNIIAGGRLEKGSKTTEVLIDPAQEIAPQFKAFLEDPNNLTFIPRWAGGQEASR